MRKIVLSIVVLICCILLISCGADTGATEKTTLPDQQTGESTMIIEKIVLSTGGMLAESIIYEAVKTEKGVHMTHYKLFFRDGDDPKEIYADFEGGQDLYDKVNQLVNDYRIDQWDGFSGSDPIVVDGDTFEFKMVLTNGQEINASGSNAYPENYGGFVGAFESLFNSK